MKKVLTIDPVTISTGRLHSYLLAAVAPRPIAFASTTDKQGNVNLSPFSFFNCFGVNPPIMIFSPARRVRDNTTKDTLDNVREVPEVVINVVNFPIVEQMSLASTEYEKGVNEFVKAGLTQVPSDLVRPPRVGESPVAFECLVEQVIETGTGGGAGNLVVARVVRLHIQEQFLNDNNELDTIKLDLVGRMGANWYCRASGGTLFEIPKPLTTKGIGIDQLPYTIRNSNVLTGNDLGRLGNIEKLPPQEEVRQWAENPAVSGILKVHAADHHARLEALHYMAKNWLEMGNTPAALNTLLVGEYL